MADDLKNRSPADRARINVNERWELVWWCKKWGVTATQLRDAVNAVGVSADAVAKRLGELSGRR